MALFDQDTTIVPRARPRFSRGTVTGLWALVIALVVLLVITFLPTAYVIQQPGPVYNTLGTVKTADGDEVPLISVEDAETYPPEGALDLLTVQVVGNPERRPSWFELAVAWFDPSRAVLPLEAIFPPGQTTEQRNEQNAALMVDSQQEAAAAALSELGYEVTSHIAVHSLTDDSAAEGLLEPGDVILTVDGIPATDAQQVRDAVVAGEGEPVTLVIDREGQRQEVSVTPREIESEGEATWLIGVQLMAQFDLPVDVTIQLDDVGGPSAGMMFALGIIDVLSPGDLTGGERIAGTGTIDAEGEVGRIGGIRQKLYGARDAGAEYFLAPEGNCDEVVGHIPSGVQVFAVADLDDALDVLDAVRTDGDLGALPTCGS
ncbi:PDZ domain-containing protein [Microbacterium lushaniae]|nr:PDZ domain-containing protein [Microbacterium lushaniae]KAA9158791.1 PDZ domain-containing protein [Microbacterium lushaniae]